MQLQLKLSILALRDSKVYLHSHCEVCMEAACHLVHAHASAHAPFAAGLTLFTVFSHCFHIVFTLRPILDATGAAAPAVSHLTYLRGRDCHSHQWQLLLGSIPAQHIINQQRPDCGVRLC